jgi:hypothetical protein
MEALVFSQMFWAYILKVVAVASKVCEGAGCCKGMKGILYSWFCAS